MQVAAVLDHLASLIQTLEARPAIPHAMFTAAVYRRDRALILDLCTTADPAQRCSLAEAVSRLEQERTGTPQAVIVDLGGCECLPSAAIGCLLAARQAAGQELPFFCVAIPASIMETLAILGLTRHLLRADNVDAALERLTVGERRNAR